MRAIDSSAKFRVGIMAAIFVAALGFLFLAERAILSPTQSLVQAPAAAPPPFKAAAGGRHAEAIGRAKAMRAEQRDPIKAQVHPAIVTVSWPRTIFAGAGKELTLSIKPNPSASGDFSLPQGMDRLAPVRNDASGDPAISVYETQVSEMVTVQLHEPSAGVTYKPQWEETLQALPNSNEWKWDVPMPEAGTRALEFELLSNVRFEAKDKDLNHFPIGTIVLRLEVGQTVMQQIKYYLDQVGALGQSVLAVAGAIGVLGGAWPIVRKLVPVSGSRAAPDAKTAT